jgi:hypothetical protein
MRKFYGGIIQDVYKRYRNYPLNNEKLTDILGTELIANTGSSVNEYDTLAVFINGLKPIPVDVIEIGTFLGVGSAVLASYARSCFTFDITYRNAHPLWVALELEDRINAYSGNQKFIDDVINQLRCDKKLNINFAFIDGMHKVKNVVHDFKQVKFCKRVLFHDAHVPEIGEFIKSIGGKIIKSKEPAKFGYWEDK